MSLLITGVSSYLGQAVIARLMRENPFRGVVGVDTRAPRLLGPARFIQADVGVVDLGDLLVMNGISVVMHLAYASSWSGRSQREVDVTRRLLEAAALLELPRIVLHSRDWVYAPQEAPCDELAPLRPLKGAPAQVAGKLRVEAALRAFEAANPSVEVVTVRTSHIIGPNRGAPLDKVLEQPVIFGPMRGDPPVHLLHPEDAADAMIVAARIKNLRGPVNVAGAEALPLSVVVGVLQKRFMRAPAWLLGPLLEVGVRVRLSPVSYADVQRLHGGVEVDTTRLIETLGVRPRFTTRQTLAVWRTRYGVETWATVPRPL